MCLEHPGCQSLRFLFAAPEATAGSLWPELLLAIIQLPLGSLFLCCSEVYDVLHSIKGLPKSRTACPPLVSVYSKSPGTAIKPAFLKSRRFYLYDRYSNVTCTLLSAI
jgi:hypothetical protein